MLYENVIVFRNFLIFQVMISEFNYANGLIFPPRTVASINPTPSFDIHCRYKHHEGMFLQTLDLLWDFEQYPIQISKYQVDFVYLYLELQTQLSNQGFFHDKFWNRKAFQKICYGDSTYN